MKLIRFKAIFIALALISCWNAPLFASPFEQRLIEEMIRSAEKISPVQIKNFIGLIGACDRKDIVQSDERVRDAVRNYSEVERREIAHVFLTGVNQIVSNLNFRSRADLDELEVIYYRFLGVLSIAFPEAPLQELFFKEPGNPRNFLSLAGIRTLLHHLNPKEAEATLLHWVKRTKFYTLDQIPAVFLNLDQRSQAGNKVDQHYVIRHTIEGREPHLTPVFVHLSKAGVWEVVILDSLGLPWDRPHYKTAYLKDRLYFVELIASQINLGKKLSRPVKVYTPKTARQTDMCSCGVMTLLDVIDYGEVNFSEFLENLIRSHHVHALEPQERVLDSISVELNAFDFLPSSMMRTVQSDRALREFLALTLDEDFVDSREVDGVNDLVRKYTVNTEDGDHIHYFARVVFFRHVDWLLRQCLKLEQKE